MNSFKDNNRNNFLTVVHHNNNDSFKDKTSKVSFLKKYNLNKIPPSRTKKKKFLAKSLSSSILNQSNLNNNTFIIKHIHNSSIGESINNLVLNMNENITNKGSLDSHMINYASNNILNSEKITIKNKLNEYLKLIDNKLNVLKSTRRNSINTDRTRTSVIKLKSFHNEGKFFSFYNNHLHETIYDKIGKKIKCMSNKS